MLRKKCCLEEKLQNLIDTELSFFRPMMNLNCVVVTMVNE